MHNRLSDIIVGCFILLFVGIIHLPTATAQTLSTGCAAINAATPDRTGSINIQTAELSGTGNFNAGEIITWSVSASASSFFSTSLPDPGIMLETRIRTDGSSVWDIYDDSVMTLSQSYSLSDSVTLAIMGTYDYRFLAEIEDLTGEYFLNASVSVSCGLPAPEPEPEPDPVDSFATVTFPLPATPPDDRVNWGFGDTDTVAYSQALPDGASQLIVYCWDDSAQGSSLGFVITPDDVAGIAPTDDPQRIASVEQDDCMADFYVLPDGHYQLNIITYEGKIYTLIDSDLNFRDAERSYFDPNE